MHWALGSMYFHVRKYIDRCGDADCNLRTQQVGRGPQDHLGYTELQEVGEQPSHGLGRVTSLREVPSLKTSLGCMRHLLKNGAFGYQSSVVTLPSPWLFQIIGRGNDQVAISSKFETREDIGESAMGLVEVGLR